MTIKRWFFVVKDEGGEKSSVYLYDTESSDTSKALPIQQPMGKSKTKADLGPVVSIESTDGKSEKVKTKYGPEHGLFVRS